MDPYEVYRLYLALRLHFTKESYDITKTKGGVKPSRQAFMKRNDLFAIRKLAKTKSRDEIIDFLVANFVSGNNWGGVFDSESDQVYNEWKTRMQRLSYQFKQDLQVMFQDGDPFYFEDGKHPAILKLYLGKKISIESIAILEKMGYISSIENDFLAGDIIWKDFIHLVKKYKIFVKVDKEKFNNLFIQEKTGVMES